MNYSIQSPHEKSRTTSPMNLDPVVVKISTFEIIKD
jgi:hypothetical protein